MKQLVFSIALLPIILITVFPINSQAGFGQHVNLTLGAEVAEGMELAIRSGTYFGERLEQIDQVQSAFDSIGVSGSEYAATARLKLGRLGVAELIGMAEVAVYNREIADSSIYDDIITRSNFRQYLPRTGVTLRLPLASGFSFELDNLFERRLISQPSQFTFWVWRPRARVITPAITPWKVTSFVDYEGFTHRELRYLASMGYGVVGAPIAGLAFEIGVRTFWKPEVAKSTNHMISFRAQYLFGKQETN